MILPLILRPWFVVRSGCWTHDIPPGSLALLPTELTIKQKTKKLKIAKKLQGGWWGNCADSLVSTIACRKMGKIKLSTELLLYSLSSKKTRRYIYAFVYLFILQRISNAKKNLSIVYFNLQLTNFNLNLYSANIIYFLSNYNLCVFLSVIFWSTHHKKKEFISVEKLLRI